VISGEEMRSTFLIKNLFPVGCSRHVSRGVSRSIHGGVFEEHLVLRGVHDVVTMAARSGEDLTNIHG